MLNYSDLLRKHTKFGTGNGNNQYIRRQHRCRLTRAKFRSVRKKIIYDNDDTDWDGDGFDTATLGLGRRKSIGFNRTGFYDIAASIKHLKKKALSANKSEIFETLQNIRMGFLINRKMKMSHHLRFKPFIPTASRLFYTNGSAVFTLNFELKNNRLMSKKLKSLTTIYESKFPDKKKSPFPLNEKII